MSAIISDCETFKYSLSRFIKGKAHKRCLFIMLNPSTADAEKDDPTIRRCIGYARDWNCGMLTVVNLFAFRATQPADLFKAQDPVGPDNMHHVLDAVMYTAKTNGPIIAAWGAHGGWRNQDRKVIEAIDELCMVGATPTMLALTKEGHPRHPLYLRKDLKPIGMASMNGIDCY